MGRKTIKRRGRPPMERPSAFFIIALILGVVLLVFIFTQVIRRPVTAPQAPAQTSTHTR